jgi:hypothetical protein
MERFRTGDVLPDFTALRFEGRSFFFIFFCFVSFFLFVLTDPSLFLGSSSLAFWLFGSKVRSFFHFFFVSFVCLFVRSNRPFSFLRSWFVSISKGISMVHPIVVNVMGRFRTGDILPDFTALRFEGRSFFSFFCFISCFFCSF